MNQTSHTATSYPEPPMEETLISSHRVKVFVGLTVIAISLIYLTFIAFQSSTVYYYTVGELQQIGPTEEGRLVRVSGKLVPNSFAREADSTLAHFTITDGVGELGAIHNGVLPDLFFNEHSEIILEGNYTARGNFESQTVIVKCPSKYISVSE